jgi:GAF domain-containing protein
VSELAWSWLAAPYVACALVFAAVALAAALTRGDRVLRLGVLGAAVAAVPWAVGQAIAACTEDAAFAWRVLRLGHGPVALVGPNLLLVLLGASGQLERYRWIARLSALVGNFFVVACWTTDWIVPGVQRVSAGMFYIAPGALTGLHVSQLAIWFLAGLAIVRKASPRAERKRTLRMFLGVLVCGAIGAVDVLLLYRVWGHYPIAWLPSALAGAIGLYLVVRTDFLRPQGLDRSVAIELGFTALATVAVAALAWQLGPSLTVVVAGATVWATLTGFAWVISRSRPLRVAGERELEQFLARVALLDDEAAIGERLATLWRQAIGLDARALWWREGDGFVTPDGQRWTLDPDVEAWLVRTEDAVAMTDLATMRLGALRPKLEELGKLRGATVIVPLVDRDELVGIVEAHHELALRESERGLIADSARAAARALTFAALARTAARERETAREVEVADALRLQASASRDAELGQWIVAAEYRPAPRTTGAGWSAIELADGRLAVLATEAQAHGVAAALATAALTGAFAAATAGTARVTLDDLLRSMRASSEGVLRSGEPVAAFLAILDARARSIEYACAGHPGGFLVGPVALLDHGAPDGSAKGVRPRATPLGGGTRDPGASLVGATRHTSTLPPDTLLVVTSSALRGSDEATWQAELQELAPASGRLASVLVDTALRRGEPKEDLLVVIVRARQGENRREL